MPSVFITGVSGYIGTILARRLLADGRYRPVVGIDIRVPAALPEGLVFIQRDVRAPLTDLLRRRGTEILIHTAFVVAPLHDTALTEDINLVGTRNVLRAAADANVRHLLYTSSTTAYGLHADNPPILEENSPLRGNADFTYAKNKRELETDMAVFTRRHPDTAVTVLRPCIVMGPGFDNVMSRHLTRRVVVLPAPGVPLQLVHEDDLARAVVLCLERTVTGVYNIAGAGEISVPEMVRGLGKTPLSLPAGLAAALNHLAWTARLSCLTEFPSPALKMMRYPWQASPRRFVRQTGFVYRYDTRETFADWADSLRG